MEEKETVVEVKQGAGSPQLPSSIRRETLTELADWLTELSLSGGQGELAQKVWKVMIQTSNRNKGLAKYKTNARKAYRDLQRAYDARVSELGYLRRERDLYATKLAEARFRQGAVYQIPTESFPWGPVLVAVGCWMVFISVLIWGA